MHMITFEKQTDVHWKVLRYGSPIGAIGVNKRSLRVYIGDVDMFLYRKNVNTLERLKSVLEMIYQQKDGMQKRLERMEIDNSIEFLNKEL